jgi:superoxide dismutase, Fe-Mn family
MERKDFLRVGALFTGAALITRDVHAASDIQGMGLDTLVDAEGNFTQAPLPYTEAALEPFMDAETLHLHHVFHHGGAVKGANNDQLKLKAAMDANDQALITYWSRKLSYHLSSHVLHSIFWTNLGVKKSTPQGELLKRIEKDFGSVDRLWMALASMSKDIDGNGWGVLGYHPYTDKLLLMPVENHERITHWGALPLLVIDVWEHAYYLKFRNKRPDFVDNLAQLVDWDNVAARLDAALKATR